MLFVLLSALLAQPAAAPAPPADCTTLDRSLPTALAPWTSPVPLAGTIRPGQAVTIPLAPLSPARTHAPIRPARQGTTTGAVVTLEVATGGTYGIALDTGAWIEVIAGIQRVASASHGHGPACTSIRKIVDFQLAPGPYTIELSGTSATQARLLVIRR